MFITPPDNKTEMICKLGFGQSALIPCNENTVKSTQSNIQGIFSKKGLNSQEFTLKKALLVFDQYTLPVAVVVVTRSAASTV